MSSDGRLVAYPLPKATGENAAETNRLNGQHEMFKAALGNTLYTTPLPPTVCSVLDMGCGTGIWSIQFAASHPSAQVLGVDIAPPSSEAYEPHAIPANCAFVQGDIEKTWNFASSSAGFDFIYDRLLIAAIRDWPAVMRSVYEHHRPGGYFELYEGIITLQADDGSDATASPAMQWYDVMRKFVSDRGVDPDAAGHFTSLLTDVGFDVVTDRKVIIHLDPQVGAQLGEPNASQVAPKLHADVEDMITIMTEKMFASSPEIEKYRALAEAAKNDIATNKQARGYHAVHTLRVARKPL